METVLFWVLFIWAVAATAWSLSLYFQKSLWVRRAKSSDKLINKVVETRDKMRVYYL